MSTPWNRVSAARPCSVCGKGDWCTYTDNAACCMRTQSDRPMANGGWLHGTSETTPARPVRHARPDTYEDPDFSAFDWWQACRRVLTVNRITPWADSLGLPTDAMDVMGAVCQGTMLAFPMHDGHGHVCGIRTRHQDGTKRAVTGSRAGVFLPTLPPDGDAVVCEGPTDATAALALGFWPIGRPSCSGCERHVVDTCRRFGIAWVTVCADSDGPGITGSRKLAEVLHAARIGTRMVTCAGHKDLRDWYKTGTTRAMVDAAWSQAEWR